MTKKTTASLFILCFVFLFVTQALFSKKHPSSYQLKTITSQLEYPWDIAFLPDNSMLVTQKPGKLAKITNKGVITEIKNISPVLFDGQGGLLSIILDPDFKTNQTLYLAYSEKNKKGMTLVIERSVLTQHSLSQKQVIFRAKPYRSAPVHFGCRMLFLPDKTLVFTNGDGFNYREKAQKLDNHFGKILRIHRDGSIPQNNPFIHTKDARPEIYSLGHRNAQGLVYIPQSKQIISHEHGPKGGDELNIIKPGKNYGWPKTSYGLNYSGTMITPFQTLPGIEDPIIYWVPSIAVSGMTYYDKKSFPTWTNSLFISSLIGQDVRRIVLKNDKVILQESLFSEIKARIRHIVTAPNGDLILLTDEKKGRLIRIKAKSI